MGEEAMEWTVEIDQSFVTGWAGVAFAAALAATGNSARAAEVLIESAGGPELPSIPGGWPAFGFEVLTRCYLDLDRPDDAARRREGRRGQRSGHWPSDDEQRGPAEPRRWWRWRRAIPPARRSWRSPPRAPPTSAAW